MGSHSRRAAEVADIFRRWRDGKFRDDSDLFSVLRSTAFAGVERSGRGGNPRPAREFALEDDAEVAAGI